MSTIEFDAIIDEFRGTTEHTYIAVIKHSGKYYVSRKFTDDRFRVKSYTIRKGGLFKPSNKELRKEIALQIQNDTPFKNTDYNDECMHYPVSLRKMFLFKHGAFFKRTKVAVFFSNTLERSNNSIELPYGETVKEQSDKDTVKLMLALKRDTYWAPFLAVSSYFVVFLLLSFFPGEAKINLDFIALVFAIISQFRAIFGSEKLMFRLKIGRKSKYFYNCFGCCGIQEMLIFFMSLFIAYIFRAISISSSTISKLGIAFIFSGVLIDIWKREQ